MRKVEIIDITPLWGAMAMLAAILYKYTLFFNVNKQGNDSSGIIPGNAWICDFVYAYY